MGHRRSRWKPGFVLVWTNAAAARLLHRARRYLRVKSQHVDALLEFTEHLQNCERRRDELGRLLTLSESETEVREAFFRRLKRLNLRGVAGLSQGTETPDSDRDHRRDGRISTRYLAGFIDGEGSLMITKSRSRKSGYVQYRARVSLANTDRRILEQISHRFGGTIHPQSRENPRWKPCYMIVWTEGLIVSLLEAISHHLRLKRKQAAVQLEFISHKTNTSRTSYGRGRGFAPHSKEVVQFRETLYQRMKGLNARGVASPG